MSAIIERIQVSSTEMLEPKNVLEGSKYAIEKLAMRGSWEKSLHDFVKSKNLLCLSVFLSISFFFIFAILAFGFFNCWDKYMCPNKCSKVWLGVWEKSTKIIEKTVKNILIVKLILIIPTIGFLIKALLIFLTIYSSCLLVAPSVKQFRVVGSCMEEICINNQTNKYFAEGDLCVPGAFK